MDTPNVEPIAEQAVDALQRGPVWVSGATGSGRSMLLRRLKEQIDHAVAIDLPSLDEADAAAALRLSLLTAVPDHDDRRMLGDKPFAEQAAAAASRLRDLDIPLVVRVPSGWSATPRDEADDRRLRARRLLRVLADTRTVWIADAGIDPLSLGIPVTRSIPLPSHRVQLPLETWGAYAHHATALREEAEAIEASPVVWRLAVGTVALGVAATIAAALCHKSPSQAVGGLVKLLQGALREQPSLRDAVRRQMQIRRALPSDKTLEVVQPPEEHTPLFTECLAYGEPLHTPMAVRRRLAHAFHPAPSKLQSTHAQLGDTYEALDGVCDPLETRDPDHLRWWLEKVHHLGQGGEATATRWADQVLPSPELYWDRARHLSIVRKRYAEAAEVYRQCQRAFPNDDYSAHYLAYNLQKAGDIAAAREPYRLAVKLAPSNPWWNARHICVLIEARRPIEAKRAWVEALGRLDPDGSRAQDDVWFVAHLHIWVATAWWKSGAWSEARAVLEGLPEDTLRELDRVGRGVTGLRRRIDKRAREQERDFLAWADSRTDSPRIREVWATLTARIEGLRAPAGLHTDEGLQLVWSTPSYLVELDLLADGGLHWYAADRLRDRSEASEEPAPDLPDAVIRWLHKVRHG